MAAVALESDHTRGPPIAGIVGHADLTLGEAVAPLLAALEEADVGRFRGIRHSTAWDAAPMGNNAACAGLMAGGVRSAPAKLAQRLTLRRLNQATTHHGYMSGPAAGVPGPTGS